MTLYHAVAFVDHQSAEVLQFDSESVLDRRIHEHRHFTRQHASGVRDEHEFFGSVCDAMEGIAEVLVAGRHTGIADFRHYVDKHRPLTAARIVGYEVVDHPTENQLVALGRKHFAKVDRMTDSAPARRLKAARLSASGQPRPRSGPRAGRQGPGWPAEAGIGWSW